MRNEALQPEPRSIILAARAQRERNVWSQIVVTRHSGPTELGGAELVLPSNSNTWCDRVKCEVWHNTDWYWGRRNDWLPDGMVSKISCFLQWQTLYLDWLIYKYINQRGTNSTKLSSLQWLDPWRLIGPRISPRKIPTNQKPACKLAVEGPWGTGAEYSLWKLSHEDETRQAPSSALLQICCWSGRTKICLSIITFYQ